MSKVKGYVGSESSLAALQKKKRWILKQEKLMQKTVKEGSERMKKYIRFSKWLNFFVYSAGLFSITIGFILNSVPVLSKFNVLIGAFLITHTFHSSKDSAKIAREHKISVCGLAHVHTSLTKQELDGVNKEISRFKLNNLPLSPSTPEYAN